MNACVNYMHDHSEGYVDGYKTAGDVLVAHVAQTAADQDILVYPILFNYRHYVELRLKVIIRHARRYFDIEGEKEPTGHDLLKLWAMARPLIEAKWPSGDRKDLENAESIVRQLADADKGGTTFRYESDKDGNALLNRSITHINLRIVFEVVGRLAGFLDSVDTGLVCETEIKEEFEREMRDYYGPDLREEYEADMRQYEHDEVMW